MNKINVLYLVVYVPVGTCATGWKQFNGQCYQINANNPMTWTDAKHHCEAQGAYLTTIMG